MQTILSTLRAMQQPLNARNYTRTPYTFQKQTDEPKDTLAHGVGRPGRYTGMVCVLLALLVSFVVVVLLFCFVLFWFLLLLLLLVLVLVVMQALALAL